MTAREPIPFQPERGGAPKLLKPRIVAFLRQVAELEYAKPPIPRTVSTSQLASSQPLAGENCFYTYVRTFSGNYVAFINPESLIAHTEGMTEIDYRYLDRNALPPALPFWLPEARWDILGFFLEAASDLGYQF